MKKTSLYESYMNKITENIDSKLIKKVAAEILDELQEPDTFENWIDFPYGFTDEGLDAIFDMFTNYVDEEEIEDEDPSGEIWNMIKADLKKLQKEFFEPKADGTSADDETREELLKWVTKDMKKGKSIGVEFVNSSREIVFNDLNKFTKYINDMDDKKFKKAIVTYRD